MTNENKWIRCTRKNRCPICDKPDWCGFTVEIVHCMRIESDKPIDAGGWIHKLTDDLKPKLPPKPEPRKPAGTIDFDNLHHRYSASTIPLDAANYANELGVNLEALRRLGAAWAAPYQAWAFPMRNADGEIIGIRLRNESRKWAVKGSRQGIFIPDGQIGDLCDTILVCEGPTDTAAMLSLGFAAIGRPSCQGCLDILTKLLWRRDTIIMSDKDKVGRNGAEKLADYLIGRAKSVRVIYPLRGKDAREWKAQGATGKMVQCVIDNASYWQRKE